MRESISAVFVYKKNIFHITRQPFLKAFPGFEAFPGGKVDEVDKTDILNTPNLWPIELKDKPYLWNTLKREAEEELGIDLTEMIESSEIKKILYFGSALTPSFNPFRFMNYYLIIELDAKKNFSPSMDEAEKSNWSTPDELNKLYKNNKICIVPPFLWVSDAIDGGLEHIKGKEFIHPWDDLTEVPFVEMMSGVIQFLPLSNTFPPANRTNAFLLGDNRSKRILIDPSPKDINELAKFKNTLKRFKVDEIFITHHHTDHHEYAPDLARDLKVGMSMSKDTFNRITEIHGKAYFKDITVAIRKDGETLTKYEQKKIKLLSVPGHDEGQLIPYIETLEWMIVSDLIQTVGTVVIGGPEGNMKKYFSSLKKVIKMNPKVIYPSHGMLLSGTKKIKQTLEHRLKREEEIKKLYLDNYSSDQILDQVYSGLESRLRPYALKTIESHLFKILDEL